MKISDAVGLKANTPVIYGHEKNEVSEDEAIQKVEEAKHTIAQITFEMMDRHIEIVKKSQELAKEQARKRAIERMAQERKEEHTELLAEMAIRNAERRDLLEDLRLKKLRA